MVLVVPIVVIASMQTLRDVIMLPGSVFVTLDGEVRHIKTILMNNVLYILLLVIDRNI